jgi:hypothetical protein
MAPAPPDRGAEAAPHPPAQPAAGPPIEAVAPSGTPGPATPDDLPLPQAAAAPASAAPREAPPVAPPRAPPEAAIPAVAPAPTPAPPAAVAAPPPPPRPAPSAPPARQVAPFAVSLALGPDSRLDLTLEPVELGRVEIAIERQGGEAVVTLRAERPETLALLQRDRAELERALHDAGLRGGEGGGPTLSFGPGGDGAARQERRSTSGPRRSPVVPLPEPAARASRPRGLIDLAI